MLKCREVTIQASEYLDGQMSWRERFGFKMHLFMCSHCRRLIRKLELAIRMVRQRPQVEMDDQQVERIVERVLQETKPLDGAG
jgi:anti-sigma factor ChrR (cupin superfamily)